MSNSWQTLSPAAKGAVAGVATFVIINLLLYFLHGWFSYGIWFVGPFLGIVFAVMIAWCVKFAYTPKKENE